jgi:hypothetical protein
MSSSSPVPHMQLKEIPFLDIENLLGRTIPSLHFYDGENWHCWFPAGPNSLMKIPAEPSEASYFGCVAARDSDIYLEFLNFINQRAFFPKVAHLISAINDDIFNLGASLQKFHLYHQVSKDKSVNTTRFVTTEIEYLFATCRSLFDLLQEVIATLWDMISLHDKSISKRQLPKTFGKMILNGKTILCADEIRDKFRVPQKLAQFYVRANPFFTVLREYRDNIIHRGKKVKMIFITEKGFAIDSTLQPFASFPVWKEEDLLPNNLASLRPALAHVVLETIRCCEDFADTIQQTIQFPSDIVPGFKLFLRGYHNEEFLRLNEIRDKVLWWDA